LGRRQQAKRGDGSFIHGKLRTKCGEYDHIEHQNVKLARKRKRTGRGVEDGKKSVKAEIL